MTHEEAKAAILAREALAEDAAGRHSFGVLPSGIEVRVNGNKVEKCFMSGVDIGATMTAELRQQLADVTNERDALRAALGAMLYASENGLAVDLSIIEFGRKICPAVESKSDLEVQL